MDREEALSAVEDETRNCHNGDFSSGVASMIVNKLCDDFESRVCKNCKYSKPHYDKNILLMCGMGVCNKILCEECGVTENFGCNMFKRKDDK